MTGPGEAVRNALWDDRMKEVKWDSGMTAWEMGCGHGGGGMTEVGD